LPLLARSKTFRTEKRSSPSDKWLAIFRLAVIGGEVQLWVVRSLMRTLGHISFCALLLMLFGCSKDESVTLIHPETVEVLPGLPSSATNAVLNLRLIAPSDATEANKRELIAGSWSLKSPIGTSSTIEGTHTSSQEERLMAIVSDGFQMRFTCRDNGITQSITVLFRFGEVTQTNSMGWRIVGTFK
jgi:hypothetical protein